MLSLSLFCAQSVEGMRIFDIAGGRGGYGTYGGGGYDMYAGGYGSNYNQYGGGQYGGGQYGQGYGGDGYGNGYSGGEKSQSAQCTASNHYSDDIL